MAGSTVLIMFPGEVRRQTVEALRERRVAVRIADDGAQVLAMTPAPRCDVLVCSLDLAGPEPLDACRRLGERCGACVLAIADRAGRIDPVDALQAGLADFVPHLIGAAELDARLRALLRRVVEYSSPRVPALRVGDLVIDHERREVTVSGCPVPLTRTEFDLLYELARGAGELVTRDELLRAVWGVRAGVDPRTLDAHMGRLRSKLDHVASRPELIVTVPHIGYRMAA